jgi:hypothetical protein
MNLLDLLNLPLSAYTPGKGDIKMEGKWETATGAPMYTFEMYERGEAPYVTAASNSKKLFGKTVFRTIGERTVPLRITDYGPGVKGLDIAFENPKYATNFPFQGQRDTTSPTPTARTMVASEGRTQQAPQMSTWADLLGASERPSSLEGAALALARLGQTFSRQQRPFQFNLTPPRVEPFVIPEAPRLNPFIT